MIGAPNTTFLIVEAVPRTPISTSTSISADNSSPNSSPSPSPKDAKESIESSVVSSIVGFVEIAVTREHCFALTADVPYREFRPKMTSLVVDTQFRRQGIASLLLAACVKQSRLWTGHTELILEVRNENKIGRLFYEKMGFTECVGKSVRAIFQFNRV